MFPHKWRHFHSPRELSSDLGRGGGDAYRKDGRPTATEARAWSEAAALAFTVRHFTISCTHPRPSLFTTLPETFSCLRTAVDHSIGDLNRTGSLAQQFHFAALKPHACLFDPLVSAAHRRPSLPTKQSPFSRWPLLVRSFIACADRASKGRIEQL